MLRAIVKDVDSIQPHGEPLITYRTVDFESKELQQLLEKAYRPRQVVGVEILTPLPSPKADDDIPF